MRRLWIIIALALFGAGAVQVTLMVRTAASANVALGRQVYDANCASCHGADLKGEPGWRRTNADGFLPAPPHDASGHTWHHADKLLLQIISLGTAEVVGQGYQSNMPGFADVLSQAEIRAVLDYIKSSWPEKEAAYQRQMSRG